MLWKLRQRSKLESINQTELKNLLLKNQDFCYQLNAKTNYYFYLQRSAFADGLRRKETPVIQNSSLKYSTAEVNTFKHGYLWAAVKRNFVAAAGHISRSKFQTDMLGATILVQHCLGHPHY